MTASGAIRAKSYRLEPPDGGWGILVCLGMALPFVSALASLSSFGLVFGEFLKSIGAESSAIAIITSTFFCSMSFAGLFSGSLFRRFGLRPVGLTGSVLYLLGTGMQLCATSTLHLVAAFSLVQGTGFGLIVPTSYTSFNNYFVKNRVLWMSFAQSLIGLGSMIYPILMKSLLEWYGFRGCLLVLTGINAHAVLGMLLMQPVEWHMRRVPIAEEMRTLQLPAEPMQTVRPARPTVVVRVQPETPLTQIPELDFTTAKVADSVAPLAPVESLSISHLSSRRVSHAEEHGLKEFLSRASSITSLGNWSGPVLVTDASPQMMHSLQASRRPSMINATQCVSNAPDAEVQPANGSTPRKRSLCATIVDFLDLTLFKQPIYVNIVLGITFALYSDLAFFTFQPTYLFALGYNLVDTANIIAIGAAADLASRVFLAITAIYIQVPARYIYLGGALFSIFARIAFNSITDFMGMACMTALMGFLRTWIHVPLPLIFADYLPKERFASGYGLFMFTQGNCMFLIGPIVGYIRDRTQDYVLVFNILNVFMSLCAVPWIIELLIVKFRRRSKIERDNVDEHENGSGLLAH